MTLDTRHWKLETGRKLETGESINISSLRPPASGSRGYTLVELIVAVGLFALVMTLAAGAYLMMISLNRQVQATVTGVDNLSFALDTMTRAIRTGTNYNCGNIGDCSTGASTFSFTDQAGRTIMYRRNASLIEETINGSRSALTDSSVNIFSLTFYTKGTQKTPSNYEQPYVRMLISGTISAGLRKTLPFTVETSATMRGTDI